MQTARKADGREDRPDMGYSRSAGDLFKENSGLRGREGNEDQKYD